MRVDTKLNLFLFYAVWGGDAIRMRRLILLQLCSTIICNGNGVKLFKNLLADTKDSAKNKSDPRRDDFQDHGVQSVSKGVPFIFE